MTRLRAPVRYLTDRGIEAALAAAEGEARPCAAVFTLLSDPHGRAWLAGHYRAQARTAARYGMGFAFETPTWRASSDWGDALGYSEAELLALNASAAELCRAIAAEFPTLPSRIVGQVGPRDASFVPAELMSADEAAIYHRAQMRALRDAGVDGVAALAINDVDEAVGIAIAGRCTGMPVTIHFSVDAAGQLPSGLSLSDAMREVDERTQASPEAYGVICAKPLAVLASLSQPALSRVRSVRTSAPASACAGAICAPLTAELAADSSALSVLAPGLNSFGGACGCLALPTRWPSRLPASLLNCLRVQPGVDQLA